MDLKEFRLQTEGLREDTQICIGLTETNVDGLQVRTRRISTLEMREVLSTENDDLRNKSAIVLI